MIFHTQLACSAALSLHIFELVLLSKFYIGIMAAITAAAAVPVIDMKKLNGEDRKMAMAEIDSACQQWGFFQLLNHGIPHSLLDKVQELFKEHYNNSMDAQFQKSAPAQMLNDALSEQECSKIEADWESGFFLQHSSHQPAIAAPALPADLKEIMDEFAEEMSRLADRMLEIMDENLGLEKDYLKKALAGKDSPFFGTKMCHYPPCPRPDMIDGLRSHTDAGGIILLLQDDKVDGLQVLKDGTWFDVQPMSHAIVIDIGDQLELLQTGNTKACGIEYLLRQMETECQWHHFIIHQALQKYILLLASLQT